MFKKAVILAVMIFSAVSMTGCFGSLEVNDRAFVQLMGLDKKNDLYMVTLQIYKSESGSSEPDTSKANSIAVSGKGETVSSALADAELKAGKRLFLGHIKMLIIGNGINSPADELLLFTDGNVSPSCPVVFSKDPSQAAGTLLEEGTFSAEQFLNIMSAASAQGETVFTSLADILTPDSGAAIPEITARPKEKTAKFDGLVLADRNGVFAKLSEENTLGVKILQNGFERDDKVTLHISVNGRNASVFITGAKTKLKAGFYDGKLRISAEICLKIRTAENPYGITEETLGKAVRESVREICTKAFSEAVWHNSCDIFGIKKLVRRDLPDLYGGYCGDSHRYLEESVLTIKVKSEKADL